MQRIHSILLFLALGACSSNAPQINHLFNGTDLTGWHADVPDSDGKVDAPASFSVVDGVLLSHGKPQGHLITDASYSNYRLTIEYRWPGNGGNCGVLVHASEPRNLYGMFPKSIECQLQAGHAGDFWCIGEDIAVDNMVERRGPAESWGGNEGDARRVPNTTDGSEHELGEWNEMIIECRGSSVDVWVNGESVNQGFDCTASGGQIALQAEGTPCEFRRVELVPLEAE